MSTKADERNEFKGMCNQFDPRTHKPYYLHSTELSAVPKPSYLSVGVD
jgi:hypothetical protein